MAAWRWLTSSISFVERSIKFLRLLGVAEESSYSWFDPV